MAKTYVGARLSGVLRNLEGAGHITSSGVPRIAGRLLLGPALGRAPGSAEPPRATAVVPRAGPCLGGCSSGKNGPVAGSLFRPDPRGTVRDVECRGRSLVQRGAGLAGRSSLSRVLEQHRGVPKGYRFSPLTVDRILASMDEHHRQTGWWPNLRSGAVAGAEGENWGAIDTILRTGGRGLPAGSSLAKLRAANGARCADAAELPLLTVETILAWADAHHEGCDRWPDERSGPVYHAAGEIWAEINEALHEGTRGLPGGTSLVELLVAHPWRTPSPAARNPNGRADPCLGRSVPRPDRKVARPSRGRGRRAVRPDVDRDR